MHNKLTELKEYAVKNRVPIITDEVKELLLQTLLENKPQTILEIGTAIGYSGTILLSESSESMLTTVDINTDRLNVARESFSQTGLQSRVTVIEKDAMDVLYDLKSQKAKFDFIFLDGPKGQYINYLPHLIELLNVNGILFADNVLHGSEFSKVDATEKAEKRNKTIIKRLEQFLYYLVGSPNLSTTILDVHDGVSISKKIKE